MKGFLGLKVVGGEPCHDFDTSVAILNRRHTQSYVGVRATPPHPHNRRPSLSSPASSLSVWRTHCPPARGKYKYSKPFTLLRQRVGKPCRRQLLSARRRQTCFFFFFCKRPILFSALCRRWLEESLPKTTILHAHFGLNVEIPTQGGVARCTHGPDVVDCGDYLGKTTHHLPSLVGNSIAMSGYHGGKVMGLDYLWSNSSENLGRSCASSGW